MSSSPYQAAGSLLSELLPNEDESSSHKQRRGLKSLAFDKSNKKKPPDKATYATVCKTMQSLTIINAVLNSGDQKLRKAIGFDTVRNKGLLYVMLYELLFGKYKGIRGGGKIKRMIVKHEKELRKEADDYVAKHGGVAGVGGDKRGVHFPRYVRVNVMRSNVSEIVNVLKEGFASSKSDANNEIENIYADAHVPDLLVLPPAASSWLHDHESVKSGKIVLQDKSSCFSALVMARGHPSNDTTKHGSSECCDYIDACSAPGNKTSHLAALVHASVGIDKQSSSGKKKKKSGKSKPMSTIFAFERNSTRFNILSNRMDQLVPSDGVSTNVSVEPIHADFLKADPSDSKFANVRAILLDPSCSGSGIVNSPDRWMEDNTDDDAQNVKQKKKRIQSLANFQLLIVKHAMSFPNVDRIVYSTCSIHDEENEAVVGTALSEFNEKGSEDGNEWELVAPACLEHWPRRGNEGGIGGLTASQASCLIRCDGMDGDETNGFFVSYFERKRLRENISTDAEKSNVTPWSTDVPVYAGQFLPIPIKQEEIILDTTTADVKEEEQESIKLNPKSTKKPDPVKSVKTGKSVDKLAKKREKKLAWKKKQALLKGQRLKKKEGSSKTL